MNKSILNQFLKAGFVFKDKLFTTDEVTTQGGLISSILANMALDGIQNLLVENFDTNSKGKVDGILEEYDKAIEKFDIAIKNNEGRNNNYSLI